jgi:hypothetical protein
MTFRGAGRSASPGVSVLVALLAHDAGEG